MGPVKQFEVPNDSDAGKPAMDDPVVGLMINPTSRRNRKYLDQLLQIVGDCPKIYHSITGQPEKISGGLSYLAGESVNVLAISGGDGTVSRVLTHLLQEKPFATPPVIAVLPGGTANMTAGDIGVHRDLRTAVRRLRGWAEQGDGQARLQRRSILRVSPGRNRQACYGMFFGAGAIVQGIDYTNETIHSRGLKDEFSLGLGMARSMWGIARQDPRFIRPVDMSIGIDGNQPEASQRTILLLVSSLERLFLNMHPYWGGANGKPLHMTMIRNPADRLIRNLPSLLRGKRNRYLRPDRGYVSENIEKISLGFDGPFTLDGEIMHAEMAAGPVEISSGGHLNFLRLNH